MPATSYRTFRLKRTHLRYHQVGHYAGAILWWGDNSGKIRTTVSTGATFHHDLDRRVNMDARWRGRVEPATGRATFLPPIGIKATYGDGYALMAIPRREIKGIRRLGGNILFCAVDERLWMITPEQAQR